MLSPIQYLKAALDIPYCHHEKWDGTGYPRGLIGEQILLTARIFAVVDVYDALISDRPYRKVRPKEKTLEHIKSGSGTHFDPNIVKLVLDSLNKKTCRRISEQYPALGDTLACHAGQLGFTAILHALQPVVKETV